MKVILPDAFAETIKAHAVSSYPLEACGLLSGTRDGDRVRISGIHKSANVTAHDPRTGFEIDPKLRFDLMRALEALADGSAIVGHYHSHPDHPAAPSDTDLTMTYETDFIWLICGVTADGAMQLNAFQPLPDRSRFTALDIDP